MHDESTPQAMRWKYFEAICTRTAPRKQQFGQRNEDMYRTEESRVVRRRCRVMTGLGTADYGALR